MLTVSGSPHVHGDSSVKNIMYTVVIAMVPAMLVSVYFFGLDALRVLVISSVACLFFEWLIQKYLIKGPVTIMMVLHWLQGYCWHLMCQATSRSG